MCAPPPAGGARGVALGTARGSHSVGCSGVPFSDLGIADDANDGNPRELAKGLRHFAFLEKEFLTIVTPCLQVVGVGAVLDESRFACPLIQKMAANHRGNPLAVCAAIHE